MKIVEQIAEQLPLIAFLLGAGEGVRGIAKATEISKSSIARWLPNVKARIAEIERDGPTKDHERQLLEASQMGQKLRADYRKAKGSLPQRVPNGTGGAA